MHRKITARIKFVGVLSIALLIIVCLQSCKKDKEATTDTVTLVSFGPTGVKHGEEIRFIGTQLDKVTQIKFTGSNATVDKAAFTTQSSTLITLIVPQGAERGRVTLVTSLGEIVSKALFDLNVLPVISSITAEARPGATIALKGSYLNWVTAVTFTDEKVVSNFESQKFDELVVKVPEEAKTGTLVINYSGTDEDKFETETAVKVTLPIISAITPALAKHAENVTLTGTNLDLIEKVYFNNVSAAVTDFVSQSTTQLVLKVPGATKKGKIKVEVASGVQTESAGELDIVMPAISAMAPNPVEPGTNLTISGTNLNLVTGIRFENVTSPVTNFVSQSASQIVVKIPTGIANGLVTLTVLNSSLTVQSADLLKIAGSAPPPTIAFHLYNDAVVNWNGWIGDGWGGTKDYANTTPVRVGTKSIKVVYNAGSWGSPIQLGAGTIPLTPYTMFKISVYPTAATAGMTLNVQFNGSGGYSLKLDKAGEWKDYAIPLSSITSQTTLTQLIIQDAQGVGGTIYVDEIGLN